MNTDTLLLVILIAVASTFVLVVGCVYGVCAMLNKIIFARQDKNPAYIYFSAEDFNLTTEDISVTYRGQNLYAKIYSVKPLEECEKVVIFQHGFGAGTSSYMTEIAALAKMGYAVVAADAYGCNNSEGKKVIGFYAGAEAVIAAYIGVKRDERLKNKKIVLVGHSWGAYSVCCAAKRVKVDGVVALSGFNAPAQCVCDQIKSLSRQGKAIAPILHPFFFIINFLTFGAKGNTKAANALKKSGVKALLIHGEEDKTVLLKHSVAYKAQCANAEKLILKDKKHNPYNTVEAESQLATLFSYEENGEEFLKSFDWKKATEEDEEFMAKIDSFIQGV